MKNAASRNGIQKLSSDELRNYIVTGDVRSLSTSTDSGRDGGYTVIPGA